MGRPKLWRQKSIAHARTFKNSKTPKYASPLANAAAGSNEDQDVDVEIVEYTPNTNRVDENDNELTRWTGGVNHCPDSDSDGSDFSWWEDTSSESNSDSDEPGSTSGEDSDSEEDEEAWRGRLQREIEHELELLGPKPSAFELLMENRTKAQWKKAESNRSLGYNGKSGRTQRRKDKMARDKECIDAKLRNSNGADMMRQFLTPKPKAVLEPDHTEVSAIAVTTNTNPPNDAEIFTGYLSDLSDDQLQLEDEVSMIHTRDPEDEDIPSANPAGPSDSIPSPLFNIRKPAPLKRRRLDVPSRVARQKAREERCAILQRGLTDIEKVIGSTRTNFVSGREGLQAYRARAIQSYLFMVVKNGRKGIEASERAAESQGFSAKWGGRLVRQWVRRWLEARTLPESSQGRHIKSFTLLEDPAIRSELRSYLRSNKWAMNPAKLAEFNQKTMIPAAAEKYLRHIVDEEMPRGLKHYLEVELFPRIREKVSKGVTIETARKFLHQEANNGQTKSWVPDGEQPLKKKGAGRGIHQSDVVCATVGWVKEASQSLEYGKNYEGYWDGALFVKQIREKIIPAFERAHGPGYQALIMVDNSQGHCAYAEDALLVSRMNLRPGGKQARLRDGWFIRNGTVVTQKMIFPSDHKEFPDQPKGMKQILIERGLWDNRLLKRYLREHCDYTFPTLQANLPIALGSINKLLIRKWQNRMMRWVDAYRDGLNAKNAQIRVQAFSSKKYTSHRRVPERVAAIFD
ncbi:hypothetical protein HYPSUDRAFT_193377 [Hypholoma sublateritium FD-334 SS-4]|uniref:DDE-1 domain-containing protein n=1 Tax=Hypholoma sublateritium (strain FD-334 SS-4) TaxID=945553 RepID=A0A0D2KNR9_HYPSF|nr:hypothetical protein HYPSUDRAFT_193377 [Hypholoma sublateritium FD-334 SS-4]